MSNLEHSKLLKNTLFSDQGYIDILHLDFGRYHIFYATCMKIKHLALNMIQCQLSTKVKTQQVRYNKGIERKLVETKKMFLILENVMDFKVYMNILYH